MSSPHSQAPPLISVIVPCYNYAEYVGEAVRSVLAQDHESFELIVVDDGSSDDSVEVIKSAIAQWQPTSLVRRVELVCQRNAGVSAALNSGLAKAQGQFIATFDADDVMPAGRLKVQAEYLLEHPEVGCLGGGAVRIDETGQRLPKKDKKRAVRRYDFAQALADALVVGGNIAIFRREAIDLAGGYDPEIKIQDFQMTLKVAHAGYVIDILPQIVTLYRKHPASLSSNYRLEYESGLQVIEAYSDHPAYASGRAKLVIKALRSAVTDDKALAWSLVRQVPLKYWDAQLLRRLRHLLFKKAQVRQR
ncbi:glycosyltransferase family 2 protein [Halopseudomonas pelagia]|uniref:glycosyltransferase family 2 protein n=1 Tax=Halopseudomonas pelagia TaxID=553151 RepID=UPI0030D8F6FC|tara:strand:- start:274042 stop:274956 length:915 start_codon:yes stop_codon:yes gene_type:complete